MAYSEDLAARIRAALAHRNDVEERKMFGGLCFMVAGHMACGVLGDVMMLRLGEAAAAALGRPHTRAMDFTGRTMPGMLYVDPAGLRSAAQLRAWTMQAESFVDGLPPRAARKAKTPASSQSARKAAPRRR